jgi:hypothetical protein
METELLSKTSLRANLSTSRFSTSESTVGTGAGYDIKLLAFLS